MRKLEIKHPEYGKFGRLESAYGKYYFGPRIDFYPNVRPQVPPGEDSKPDPKHKDEVTKKSLEILDKVFLDGVPLTDLYDWEMNISSRNASGHGWGVPDWRYYLVGTRKKEFDPKNTELKEMVMESVLKILNEQTNDPAGDVISRLSRWFALSPAMKTQVKSLTIEPQEHGSMNVLVFHDMRGNKINLLHHTSREAIDRIIPTVADFLSKASGKQADKAPGKAVVFL